MFQRFTTHLGSEVLVYLVSPRGSSTRQCPFNELERLGLKEETFCSYYDGSNVLTTFLIYYIQCTLLFLIYYIHFVNRVDKRTVISSWIIYILNKIYIKIPIPRKIYSRSSSVVLHTKYIFDIRILFYHRVIFVLFHSVVFPQHPFPPHQKCNSFSTTRSRVPGPRRL